MIPNDPESPSHPQPATEQPTTSNQKPETRNHSGPTSTSSVFISLLLPIPFPRGPDRTRSCLPIRPLRQTVPGIAGPDDLPTRSSSASLYFLMHLRYGQPFWRSLGWTFPLAAVTASFLAGPLVAINHRYCSATCCALPKYPCRSSRCFKIAPPSLCSPFSSSFCGPLCEELAFSWFSDAAIGAIFRPGHRHHRHRSSCSVACTAPNTDGTGNKPC